MFRFKNNFCKSGRRDFIKQGLVAGSGILIFPALAHTADKQPSGMVLEPSEIIGLKKFSGPGYLKNATWYAGDKVGDGFSFEFPVGSLADKKYITTDILADGNHMVKFRIELQEANNGRIFIIRFGVLNQCSLRVRVPLNLVNQDHWGISREGGFLKPRCSGDRVNLKNVDKMRFYVYRKSTQTSKFCITPIIATKEEVPVIEHPILPKGQLIDEIGQSAIHEWDAKTKDKNEMVADLRKRLDAANHKFPDYFSEIGSWKKHRLDNGTGFFRVHKDEKRWWFIDPDGYYFWSAGVNCVRDYIDAHTPLLEDTMKSLPAKNGEFSDAYMRDNSYNHLSANFIRAFGKNEWRNKWATFAFDELKRLRFNTIGNWSDREFASNVGLPYVRTMSFSPKLSKNIYRDFPDVFHPNFEIDAFNYAQVLSDTTEDPKLLGYFMMNEPQWGFSSELPAAGMLYNSPECATREVLADFLREKYTSREKLSSAWGFNVTFGKIEKGEWNENFSDAALKDLEIFSKKMVEKYFGTLSWACKKVDTNHLNLGIRYAEVPPKWALSGMKSFDVFSMNCYYQRVPFEQTKEIHDKLQMPVIIGEWHFGALDAGLPSSGIGHVPTQKDRGRAYRIYFENAAANPYCIGVHWFTFYDQSAIGRFDGENYNIGFLDVCNKPYKELCNAAVKSHEMVYEVAGGLRLPYDDEPEYLPNLF